MGWMRFAPPDDLLGLMLFQAVGGALVYFVLAGASYLFFFVWRKERYRPAEPPEPGQTRQAILWSLYGIVGNAVLAAPIQFLVLRGYGRVYLTVEEYGWSYLVASLAISVAFTETCVYWIHRGLHEPRLYRALHKYHHQFIVPTPWVSMAFHPLDSFFQALPTYVLAFLIPMHRGAYLGLVLFITAWTFLIHDQVTFVPLGVVNYTAHHTLHHLYNDFNYGQFLTVWDRLAGTYRDPKRETVYEVMR